MNNIFIIPGYGVPKDIFKDENYNFYLKMAFNKIYDSVISRQSKKPFIIFSGGKTDCFKPYKRSEAEEMAKFFKKLASRPIVRKTTKDWLFTAENKSLSALENLLYGQKIILKKSKAANVYVFCEQTRQKKVDSLAKEIFGKNYRLRVIPVDFDVSANRYLDSEFIAEKEQKDLKLALWALQNPENLRKYRRAFRERMEFLRKAGPKKHAQAVKKWWEKKLKELDF